MVSIAGSNPYAICRDDWSRATDPTFIRPGFVDKPDRKCHSHSSRHAAGHAACAHRRCNAGATIKYGVVDIPLDIRMAGIGFDVV